VVTDVPPLRSKQDEHFLSSPSFFFPLLSRNPTGTLAVVSAPNSNSCRMDGRNCT
jgi:hypothetical protein